MSLSRSQNAIYRPLVKTAYRVYLEKGGTLKFDPWYRHELVTAAGIYTTKQIQGAEDFDALCLHFATLTNDQEQIDYWSRAPERRALWRLDQTMAKAGVGWAYVEAIAQKRFDRPIAELPAELILKINVMIYKHWKRHETEVS